MPENLTFPSPRNTTLILPPISDVLSSQFSSKSHEKETTSSQDTSVNPYSDTAEDNERSTSSRQKIELAINELNMDEASIKDLKNAFSLEEGGSDVASALLGLGRVKRKEHRAQLKYGMQIPKQMPYYYATPPRPTNLFRNNFQRIAVPPYHYPRQMHIPSSSASQISVQRPAVIRRTKEFTSIKIKLRQTEEYWEVLAITFEFEPRQVNMQLVKYPSKQANASNLAHAAERDALLIEASKVILLHSADGSILEKTISARSLIPLGGFARSSSLGICQVGNGITRIRIFKLINI